MWCCLLYPFRGAWWRTRTAAGFLSCALWLHAADFGGLIDPEMNIKKTPDLQYFIRTMYYSHLWKLFFCLSLVTVVQANKNLLSLVSGLVFYLISNGMFLVGNNRRRLTTSVFTESHVLRNAKYFAWCCLIELKIILSFVVVRHASHACWRPGSLEPGLKHVGLRHEAVWWWQGCLGVKMSLAMWEGMPKLWDGAGTCAKNPSCWRPAQCLCPKETTLCY